MTNRRIVSAVSVVYLLLSPLPLVGFVVLRVYSRSLEGMGSWALAASMGPWLVGSSACIGLAGMGIAWWRLRRGLSVTATLLGAALSGCLAAWWAVRAVLG